MIKEYVEEGSRCEGGCLFSMVGYQILVEEQGIFRYTGDGQKKLEKSFCPLLTRSVGIRTGLSESGFAEGDFQILFSNN